MTKRRDRHDRGMRGPRSLPNPYTGNAMRLPGDETAAEFFLASVRASIQSIMTTCPSALTHVDIGVEDVPDASFDGLDQIPLIAALEGPEPAPKRIVLFRRPIEQRSPTRDALRRLIHSSLVEQLSVVTGTPTRKIDPKVG